MAAERIHRHPVVMQMEGLQPRERLNGSIWTSWLERIGRPELHKVWNDSRPAVYFSAEYGLPGLGANGGLGMLSRDHFLQAVELHQPTMFIGLLYSSRKEQCISSHSSRYFQENRVVPLPTPEELNLERVAGVDIRLNGAYGPNNHIPVYRYPIGNKSTQLLLLQVPGEVYPGENNSDARGWNNAVLGFGGYELVRQLKALGKIEDVSFYHLNESATVLGALAALDNLTLSLGNNHDAYNAALNQLREKAILTNHTLVPAAEASFSVEQCNALFLNNLHSQEVKKHMHRFIHERGGQLKLLDLALYLAGQYNGVSELHAKEAVRVFEKQYGRVFYGNPIEFRGVTNGIYERGWNARMTNFLEEKGVIDEFGLPAENFEQQIDAIPTRELAAVKAEAKQQFRHSLAEGKWKDQFGQAVELPEDYIQAGDGRRVAGYKRRWMMFKRPDRLRQILEKHPRAHVIFTGKAHPNDEQAKAQLSFVMNSIAGDPLFKQRIHYLVDYSPDLMAEMGPACDLWLNTPVVGEEACGTSGMKTGLGGALQESTQDGFYAELPSDSYFAISGETNSEAEFDSYYDQLDAALTAAENRDVWAEKIKAMWKKGYLHVASGARMLAMYANMAFPREQD